MVVLWRSSWADGNESWTASCALSWEAWEEAVVEKCRKKGLTPS